MLFLSSALPAALCTLKYCSVQDLSCTRLDAACNKNCALAGLHQSGLYQSFLMTMFGNLLDMSLLFSATLTAILRAISL